ncbi:LIRP [Nilaparvata lugens]|uniref:LIRP n=1 Tax=Nilaparvata lugens TaxID=108931 RepID=UPI00193DC772|nr:LIRP [Nilaparvata lugens]XP_022187491.2 LIRP [Nilaparvata lugens]
MFPTRIILLILGIESILANKDLVLISEERQTFHVCGHHLATLLNLVCEGNYNGQLSKKSSTGEIDWQREMEQQQLETEDSLNDLVYQFPFRSRAHANAFLAPDGVFRRHTRGIVEECCKKPCTKYELKMYCADSK